MRWIRHFLIKARLFVLELQQQVVATEHSRLQVSLHELELTEPRLRQRLRQLTEAEIGLRQRLIKFAPRE